MAPTADVTMRWLRDLQFEGNGTGRPPILVDGNSKAATSPVELLLVAAATCTASDVVIILQKQRVKLERLDISVQGTRRETEPRRYTAIAFHFVVRGEGADDVKVRRAIEGAGWAVLGLPPDRPDGQEVLGCVYIYPPAPGDPGDASIRSWVRADHAALDSVLYAAVRDWLAQDWPFHAVDYAPRS